VYVSADQRTVVDVLIPVLGPTEALPHVLDALPRDVVRHVIIVRVGHADEVPAPGEPARAAMLSVPEGGLGAAVLRGMEELESLPERPAVVVILSADGTDDPGEIPALLRPILRSRYDLVIGSRMIGPGRGASMGSVERCGNAVAVQLIRALYGHSYTDLSTFLAIRFPALVALGITDAGAGFATELRVKALKVGLRVAEVPVSSRRPHGEHATGPSLRERLGVSYKSLFQILRNATIR
jgi:hypothetical protein